MRLASRVTILMSVQTAYTFAWLMWKYVKIQMAATNANVAMGIEEWEINVRTLMNAPLARALTSIIDVKTQLDPTNAFVLTVTRRYQRTKVQQPHLHA